MQEDENEFKINLSDDENDLSDEDDEISENY